MLLTSLIKKHGFLLVIALLFFGCSKAREDSPIVFINIQNFDRAQLAQLFRKADAAHPKLILLDLWFPSESDVMSDSILSSVLLQMQSKVVYSHRFESVEKIRLDSIIGTNNTRTLDQFRKSGSPSGHVTSFGVPISGKMVSKSFPVRIHYQEKTSWHVSLLSAQELDSLKTARFLQENTNEIELDLDQDRIDRYTRIDENWSTLLTEDWSNLNDRLVIFGYIGPTSEDKKYTLLNDNDYTSPDTYGPIILAEIISTVLEYQ